MARKLHGIFARIAVRGKKEGRHNLVDRLILVVDRAEVCRMARTSGKWPTTPKEAIGNLHGPSAREANEAQSSPRSGGRGDDGILFDLHYFSMRRR